MWPVGLSFILSSSVRYLDNYWPNCYEICYECSWSLDDDSSWFGDIHLAPLLVPDTFTWQGVSKKTVWFSCNFSAILEQTFHIKISKCIKCSQSEELSCWALWELSTCIVLSPKWKLQRYHKDIKYADCHKNSCKHSHCQWHKHFWFNGPMAFCWAPPLG